MKALALTTVVLLAGSAQADILYQNAPYDGTGIVTSEFIPAFDLLSEFADDFTLDGTYLIEDFHWDGGYYNGPPYPVDTSWTLNFYEDAGGVPGSLIYSEMFGLASVGETFIAGDDTTGFYHYEVDLSNPFLLGPGYYWASVIVGPHDFPPQAGSAVTEVITGSEGYFRSLYFGFPDWVPGSNVFGVQYDWGSFTVTGVPAPASIMLLGLGGLLARRRH